MDFFLCENRCDLQKTYDFISLHMDVLYANQRIHLLYFKCS